MAFTFLTSPNIGDSIYANGTRYYYNGTAWELAVKNAFGSRGNKTFTSTANQTTYQCPFSVDNSEVFINGIKISDSDYTVNGDGLVTLNTAPTTGSEVEVIGYGSFDISNIVAFDSKADKATTLVGYGITDAYTKTQTDSNISTAVANLVNSAPSTLDTLNELATALGNDANFSTTVTNSIATKAPIASPTFTGTVSGITKSMVGLGNVTNDTQVKAITSTANKLVKFSDTSSTITNSVIYDDGINVGIGTSSPAEKLSILGGNLLIDNDASSKIILGKGADGVDGNCQIGVVQTGSDTDELGLVFKTHDNAAGSSLAVEKMRIDHTGNVGIGTSSPSRKFEVVGDTSILDYTATNQILLTQIGDSNRVYSRVKATTADFPLSFWTGTTERMRIDSSGNVGIGTSSPSEKLHIKGKLLIERTENSIDKAILTTNSGILDIHSQDGGATSGGIRFLRGTTPQESMRIDSSGNVGIGVTPSAWHSSAKVIDIGSTTSLWNFGNTQTYLTTNAFYDGVWKYKNSNYGTSYNQANGTHYWLTAPSGTAGNTITWTQAMTLNASGNLGINTSSPSYKLDVDGLANLGGIKIGNSNEIHSNGTDLYIGYKATPAIRFLTGSTNETTVSTERMRIDSAGRITMPYQPAFAVRSSAYNNTYNINPVLFDIILLNTGNNYNSSTGRFTAPVSGNYQINVYNNMLNPNTADTILDKNGSAYAGVEHDNAYTTGRWDGRGFSIVVPMVAGDYLTVRITGSSNISTAVEGSAWNAFSGFLIG